MARPNESAEQLRERILRAMQQDIGISEHMAQPFVESVMKCFAGERLYFPASSRDYPVDQIKIALLNGMSVAQVMTSFDLSRSTLYRLFPGGLPVPVRRFSSR